MQLWDRYDDNKLKWKTEKKTRYVNNKHNVTYIQIKKNSRWGPDFPPVPTGHFALAEMTVWSVRLRATVGAPEKKKPLQFQNYNR